MKLHLTCKLTNSFDIEIKEGFAPRLELVQHQSESAWQSNRPPGAFVVRRVLPR